jgi:hypothetical protein
VSRRKKSQRALSEVAMWHILSGQPDNVTEEGLIVEDDPGRRLQEEKRLLRASIASLGGGACDEARNLSRLAASALLAGDVETARRYLALAEQKNAC